MDKKKEYLIIGISLIIIATVAVLALTRDKMEYAETEIEEASVVVEPANEDVADVAESVVTPAVQGEDAADSQPSEYIVRFYSSGYSPSELIIKKGDTIVFVNNSSQLYMWPASARHPAHDVYPTTGGCIGSTFDACKGFLPGERWEFVFDEVGTWGYHDHISPQFTGRIIVQ